MMQLLGFRPVRPPIEPIAKTAEAGKKFDEEFRTAVQRHKDVVNQSICHSFDVVDNTEKVRLSLKSIFDRATVPGEATMEGGYELVSRGRPHNDRS